MQLSMLIFTASVSEVLSYMMITIICTCVLSFHGYNIVYLFMFAAQCVYCDIIIIIIILDICIHSIVESFEAITANLASQDDFESLEVDGDDIKMLVERVSVRLHTCMHAH